MIIFLDAVVQRFVWPYSAQFKVSFIHCFQKQRLTLSNKLNTKWRKFSKIRCTNFHDFFLRKTPLRSKQKQNGKTRITLDIKQEAMLHRKVISRFVATAANGYNWFCFFLIFVDNFKFLNPYISSVAYVISSVPNISRVPMKKQKKF